MELLVSVINQDMRLATNLRDYAFGSKNFVRFRFELDEAWDGLMTFAQFAQNGHGYNLYLDEDNCVYLPPELRVGMCSLVLCGTDGVRVVATTNMLLLRINDNMLVEGTDSTKVTPTLYEQLVAQVKSLRAAVGSPLVAKTSGDMTDKTKIYVYTGDEDGYIFGNWYYWNGSTWMTGGVYNSIAFDLDTTLMVPGMAADAAAVGAVLEVSAIGVRTTSDDWENGGFMASDGTNNNTTTTTIRTKAGLITSDTIGAQADSGYKFAVYGWDGNGEYLGIWKDDTWKKDSISGAYMTGVTFADIYEAAPDDKKPAMFRIALKNDAETDINKDNTGDKLEFAYWRNAIDSIRDSIEDLREDVAEETAAINDEIDKIKDVLEMRDTLTPTTSDDWQDHGINASTGQDLTTGTTSIRTAQGWITNDIISITANEGYKFAVYGYGSNNQYFGIWKDGAWNTSTVTGAFVTEITLSDIYEAAPVDKKPETYRLVMRNLAETDITHETAGAGATLLTRDNVIVRMKQDISDLQSDMVQAESDIETLIEEMQTEYSYRPAMWGGRVTGSANYGIYVYTDTHRSFGSPKFLEVKKGSRLSVKNENPFPGDTGVLDQWFCFNIAEYTAPASNTQAALEEVFIRSTTLQTEEYTIPQDCYIRFSVRPTDDALAYAEEHELTFTKNMVAAAYNLILTQLLDEAVAKLKEDVLDMSIHNSEVPNLKRGYVTIDGTFVSGNEYAWGTAAYVPILPGSILGVTDGSVYRMNVAEYDKDKKFLVASTQMTDPYVVVNEGYVRFSVRKIADETSERGEIVSALELDLIQPLPGAVEETIDGLEDVGIRYRRALWPVGVPDGWYEGLSEDYSTEGFSSGKKADYIIDKFDALMEASDGYITKNNLGIASGTDSVGNPYSIYEYVLTPSRPDEDWNTLVRPKILVMQNQQGFEKCNVFGMYYFIKDLVENYEKSPLLQYFRENVELHVIPVVCPYSCDGNRYVNANNVSLNRNYDVDGWTFYEDTTEPIDPSNNTGPAPFSEPETKIIRDWVLSHQDTACLLVDSHTNGQNSVTTPANINWMNLIEVPNEYFRRIEYASEKHLSDLTNHLSIEFPDELDILGDNQCGHISLDTYRANKRGVAQRWSLERIGLPSLTLEGFQGWPFEVEHGGFIQVSQGDTISCTSGWQFRVAEYAEPNARSFLRYIPTRSSATDNIYTVTQNCYIRLSLRPTTSTVKTKTEAENALVLSFAVPSNLQENVAVMSNGGLSTTATYWWGTAGSRGATAFTPKVFKANSEIIGNYLFAYLREYTRNDSDSDRIYNAFPTDVVSGETVSFSDGADNIPVKDLTVTFKFTQEGSGTPSEDNIRPIVGWTGITLNHSGADTSNPNTRYITFSGTAGKAYGGILNVSTGVLTITHKKATIYRASRMSSATGYAVYEIGPVGTGSGAPADSISNLARRSENGTSYIPTHPDTFYVYSSSSYNATVCAFMLEGVSATTSSGRLAEINAALKALADAGTPFEVTYKLTTPETYQLTPIEVRTLLGENNIWADIGETTVKYRVDPTIAMNAKQDALTFDDTPTADSTNPVTSAGIKAALDINAAQIATNAADIADLKSALAALIATLQ